MKKTLLHVPSQYRNEPSWYKNELKFTEEMFWDIIFTLDDGTVMILDRTFLVPVEDIWVFV